MNHELKQVDVRLKLVDKEGVFSMEPIDTPAKAVSIMAPNSSSCARRWHRYLQSLTGKRSAWSIWMERTTPSTLTS